MFFEFLQRHRAGVLVLSLAGLSLVLMALRIGPYVTGIKAAAWFFISPEVVYSGQFFNKLDSLQGRFFRLVRVEGENHILREQNSQLSKREVEREALEIENNRLRLLLDLRQKSFPQGIPAEVVGRDTRDWFHALSINKGSAKGVAIAAAVVASSREKPVLVGRVGEVTEEASKVLLLTDAVSAISATVKRTGDMGLVEGRNKPWVELNYLNLHSEVAVGDEITTVGLGGVFPPGIPIGEVTRVTTSEDGFFKEAVVRPYARIGSLREVLVLERRLKADPIEDMSRGAGK